MACWWRSDQYETAKEEPKAETPRLAWPYVVIQVGVLLLAASLASEPLFLLTEYSNYMIPV